MSNPCHIYIFLLHILFLSPIISPLSPFLSFTLLFLYFLPFANHIVQIPLPPHTMYSYPSPFSRNFPSSCVVSPYKLFPICSFSQPPSPCAQFPPTSDFPFAHGIRYHQEAINQTPNTLRVKAESYVSKQRIYT